VNFFQPVMRLQSKVRLGSKVRKTYDQAQTPYRNIMASGLAEQSVNQELTEAYLSLNPVDLRRQIDANLARLWKLPR
jgi:hypothetical protein